MALPLYTNEPLPVDIRKDPVFAAASRNAQRLARTTSREGKLAAPLSYDDFEKMKKEIKAPGANLLLQLAWAFAARVGDLRRVHVEDVVLAEDEANSRGVPIAVTFREGKGAAFWGLYSAHAVVDRRLAQGLRQHLERIKPREPRAYLFTLGDQSVVSRALAELGKNVSLRSVRKGAVVWLAQQGIEDLTLMNITGHKRRDTTSELVRRSDSKVRL